MSVSRGGGATWGCHHLAYYPSCPGCAAKGFTPWSNMPEATTEQKVAMLKAEAEGNRIWFQPHKDAAIWWWSKSWWQRVFIWRKPWYWRGWSKPTWVDDVTHDATW